MKLIVTNKNEFEETEVSVYTNNGELLLHKTIAETITQFLDSIPENCAVETVVSRSGEIEKYIIRELI